MVLIDRRYVSHMEPNHYYPHIITLAAGFGCTIFTLCCAFVWIQHTPESLRCRSFWKRNVVHWLTAAGVYFRTNMLAFHCKMSWSLLHLRTCLCVMVSVPCWRSDYNPTTEFEAGPLWSDSRWSCDSDQSSLCRTLLDCRRGWGRACERLFAKRAGAVESTRSGIKRRVPWRALGVASENGCPREH